MNFIINKILCIGAISLFIGIPFLSSGQGDEVGDFKFRITSMLQNRITIPGTPEASSLGKYGDYKINTFTGLPNISIPLYGIQGSELSMSFNLNYEGGGIKVEQLPTWVGTGWNLDGGGVITRSVKGDPDMKINYFNYETLLSQHSNAEYADLFTENDFLLKAATKEVETQPDIFYFNMGGHSGKFYIKANKSVLMAESKDLVITPFINVVSGNVDSFYIKDAHGITYVFNIPETTTLFYNTDYGPLSRVNADFVFNSSWYLSKIINSNATEIINLVYFTESVAYNPQQYVNYNNYKSINYHHGTLFNLFCPPQSCPYGEFPTEFYGAPTSTTIANRRFLSEVILSKGSTGVEKLKFYSSTNPYVGGGRKLDSMSLFKGPNASARLLNQVFTYNDLIKRLTLIQLQEKSPGGLAKEPYIFNYYTLSELPASVVSNAIDHWGYFNNALSNLSLIPAILCPGVNANDPNCPGMNNPISGADRAPNETHAKAGVLTRIKFPTKGYTDFIWEGNRAISGDFICGDGIAERLVGGLRIKEINTYSEANVQLTSKKYSYKFADGTCSGLLFYQPRYHTSSVFQTFSYNTNVCVPAGNSGLRTSYTFSSSSVVPLGAIQGSLVGYSRVEESFAGKTVYNYKNYLPAFVSWGITQDLDIQDLGQLHLVEEYNDADQKVHSIGYKYSTSDNIEIRRSQFIYGLIVEAWDQQSNKTELCRSGTSFSWELPGLTSYPACDEHRAYHSRFLRRHYKITQDWVYNKEIADTIFYYNGASSAGFVTKLVLKGYENENVSSPSTILMNNSDGIEYKKIIKYAHDVPNAVLISRNIIGVPLQTESYVNNGLVYRNRTDYNAFATTGLISAGGPWQLPHKFYERFSGASDILRETIDRYDVTGTQVQEGRKEFDSSIVILYSHSGMVPSAKIQNARLSECAYTGFETADALQGGWTLSQPASVQSTLDGKTGIGHWTGSGTASKTAIPIGKYRLTYWTKNATALTVSGASTNVSTISAAADPNGWKYVQHILTFTSVGTVTVTGVASILVDELRLYPYDALMTTYTFDANARLISGISDPNGLPTKYEYDGLLRLTGIRNFNSAYQKIIDYNYKTSAATYNFIKGSDVLQDVPVTSVAGVNALTGSAVKRMFDYMDDIGRPMQSIGVAQSPISKDVIIPHTYDLFGREVNKYLPYADQTNTANGAFRAFANTDQATFFNSQFSGEGAYAKQTMSYENSPLNRVLSETPPGAAFSTHPVTYQYGTNSSNEVRNYNVISAHFAANTLNKVTRTDENGNAVITYTDKIGLKVMESVSGLQTYYLYDQLQNLIQVIQPETVNQYPNEAYSSTSVLEGSFVYAYDILNRMNSKKIPSTTGQYTYVYDRLDREVLRTDPNGTKLFTKYDILGRTVMTGLYTGAGSILGTEPLYESVSLAAPYYTNVAFPSSSTTMYTTTYYDDYNFDESGADEVSYTAPTGSVINYSSNYPFVLGKPTGTRTAILKVDGSVPTAFIEDYPFYDIFGRETHHKTVHHLGNSDLSWMIYDFPGRLKNTRMQHNTTINAVNTNSIINQRFTYDHASRIVNTYHQIGDVGANEKLISAQSYNERDEMATKTLGSGLQTIDYTYNIRKWLTMINDPVVSNADLFSQRLYYDALPVALPAPMSVPLQYNGNIIMSEWRTGANYIINGASRPLAAYTYTYDAINRLTSGKYSNFIGSYGQTNADRYTVNNITYDKNGNIKTMARNGQISAGTYGTIDNLTYSYNSVNKINQLSSITDASTSTQGFRSGTQGTYTYDNNGNMTSDASKNITAISYNHLNLPRTFTFSTGNTIEMTYDATGMKLSKVVKQGTTIVSRQDYVKGFEYHNSKLQAIYHSEGRVAFCDATQTLSITAPINGETRSFKAGTIIASNVISGNANDSMQASSSVQLLPGFQVEQGSNFFSNVVTPPCVAATAYEYVIRDHLGNGRIYFADYNGNYIVEESNGEILQEAHYDPWGYALGGNWVNNSSVDNLYMYNGKELNNDIGLGLMDYGARWYDAGVGRWTTVDPFSVKIAGWNPYNYALNNSIRFIDSDGLFPKSILTFDPNLGLYGGYKLTKSAIYLLALVSNVDKVLISNVVIQERAVGQYRPWYNSYSGGGGITLGTNSLNANITLTQNYFADDWRSYNGHGYGQNLFEWLDIVSHEVGHLPQISKEGGLFSYLFAFVKQYSRAGNHNDAPYEVAADEGSNKFEAFYSFLNNYSGRNSLENLFNSNSSEKNKIKTLGEWWSVFDKSNSASKVDAIKDISNNFKNTQEGTYSWNGSAWILNTQK